MGSEVVMAARLTLDPNNANRGTVRGEGMVERSLQSYGAGRSILASRDGVIIAGNKTFQKAQELGIPVQEIESDGRTLFVIRRTDLDYDDPRAKELAIADNRASETGLDWDADVLAALAEDGVDLEQFWFEDELTDLLGEPDVTEGLTDPDAVPEPPADPVTKRGDLWLLGKHRLMCGDSTVVTDVDRLMDGAKADMVFTDPPYGVDYDGGTKVREKLDSDRRGTTIYGDAIPLIAAFSDPKAPLYLWHGEVYEHVLRALRDNGYEVRAQIIWNKSLAQFGALSAQYKQKHEPCFYAFRRGETPHWYGPTNEVTVWDAERAQSNEFHPTQKPTALAERAINNSSKRGDVVLDLFGGSGSTLIACEQTGRTCYGMELSPAYCDVIVTRWEQFTGRTAERETVAEAAD